jgi:hypothetical protein
VEEWRVALIARLSHFQNGLHPALLVPLGGCTRTQTGLSSGAGTRGNGGGPSGPPRFRYSLLNGVCRGLYSPKTPLGFRYQINIK